MLELETPTILSIAIFIDIAIGLWYYKPTIMFNDPLRF
jgi:hypothetical protein